MSTHQSTSPDDQIERVIAGEVDSVVFGKRGNTASGPEVVFPGAFNPLHEGHRQMAAIATRLASSQVVFEISIINVDKQPLTPELVKHRLNQFSSDQAVLITRAATFLEKAQLLPNSQFVVGADTIQRIADAKYYQSDVNLRDSAIEEIDKQGCRFLVFGRSINREFVRLANIELPSRLNEICEAVSETEFRMDVSSTHLREQR